MPRRIVFDNRREMDSVTRKLNRISETSKNGAIQAWLAAKNIVSSAIKIGRRPLQGVKLLVKIAISRSRGDSIMRQPMTPAALQPKAMHVAHIIL